MDRHETRQSTSVPRRLNWRQCFQYRLRTLLILTTVIAITLTWWSYKAKRQREAVATIETAGGSVMYDTSLPWTGGMDSPLQWPQWLLDKVGIDYFASVQSVYLDDSQVTDAGLEYLKRLTGLKWLFLTNTQVTDAGLEHTKHLSSLRYLVLTNTQVTDVGLEHLSTLTALEVLYVEKTNITDIGLAQLKRTLPKCKVIRDWGRN